jgi:hypothetical protein
LEVHPEITMKLAVALLSGILAVALTGNPGRGEDSTPAQLKRELDLLKRENDLLKRENDLLKQEIAALKKGGAKGSAEATTPDAVKPVTVGDVEYAYKGMARNGQNLLVTLLATSKSGDNKAPMGQMILIDDEGNKYMGMPQTGFGAPQILKEGVPLKMVWRFGPNPITQQGSAPPAKITRFKSLSIDTSMFGGPEVDFRDVPVTLPTPAPTPKKK